MKTIEYTTIDKSAWGQGPWVYEPDKRQWQDPATGLPCLIVRGPVGALCGYVGVPPGHPAYGMSYDCYSAWDEDGNERELTPIERAINELNAHGGLTFADSCSHGAPERSICHVVEDGEVDQIHWFGFDCAHCGDLAPMMARDVDVLMKYDAKQSLYRHQDETYRDFTYVERQVTELAAQLKRMYFLGLDAE
jgi:hypothetical protein